MMPAGTDKWLVAYSGNSTDYQLVRLHLFDLVIAAA